MKVAIVGGGGRVGAAVGVALQLGGAAREILIIDVMKDMAAGEALDMLHASSSLSPQTIRAGGYEDAAGFDIIVHTAGLRRKPDESRLDLINRNVALTNQVCESLNGLDLAPDWKLVVVANPVDVLAYTCREALGLPRERVLGIGTIHDTTRFRSLLADWLGVDATQVTATILGEHGDSQVAIWSSAAVNGVPLRDLPGWDEEKAKAIAERTRGSGAEVIRLKQGAAYAVEQSARMMVEAIIRDSKSVLPVGTTLQGEYGLTEVCLSVPVVVGAGGIEAIVEQKLEDEELSAIASSAEVLKATIAKVQAMPA